MSGAITEHEREKYGKVWGFEQYHGYSPGAEAVAMFLDIAKPRKGARVIDIGAGAGAASRLLKDAGLQVTGFDLTDQGWRHPDIPLRLGSAWHLKGIKDIYDYVFCCDVMEHLPEAYVGLAINRMKYIAPHCFFQIAFSEDHFGAYVGEALHLTVKPFPWWRDTLNELTNVLDARDLLRADHRPPQGIFYTTRY